MTKIEQIREHFRNKRGEVMVWKIEDLEDLLKEFKDNGYTPTFEFLGVTHQIT